MTSAMKHESKSMPAVYDILKNNPIVPVVVLDNEEHAVPLAHALLEGGIGLIEVTLRTAAGLKAISRIAKEVPDIIVGAGTVLSAEQYRQAMAVGAQYIISPGLTPSVAEVAAKHTIPYLPGVATASECMQAIEYDIPVVKFFPASAIGGPNLLKQFASVFSALKFVPTGGIDASNAKDYLSLPNVLSVGGSWVAPKDAIAASDWKKITQLAKDGLTKVRN
ncbi:MAG: bifunctional 4-hydroxy-2-oxoglutarate aldolase/2-dehydro-3-deoxy-phosphogluconate aldolase [Rickettsiales bacterium]